MPGAVKLIRSATLSGVAEYAYAATAPAGSRLIFLAGACPLNDDGSTAAVGDYPGQAAKAFENLRTALADAGASVTDVIQHQGPGRVRPAGGSGGRLGGGQGLVRRARRTQHPARRHRARLPGSAGRDRGRRGGG